MVEEARYVIHLVSHTHWDREWYLSFEETRVKLVRLVDKLLKVLDSDPDYRFYVLDGQAVILEDYLQIRPEKRGLLEKHIREGRVFVGPWYVLPDEFLVSGESLIRNLLLGHRVAEEFGRVMNVGYLPDPFGHISQLPQILRGFGIDSMIFSRGLGDEGEKIGSEFIWRGPDGSELLAVRQAAGGYWDTQSLGYDNPDVSGNTKEPLNLKKALDTINRNKLLLTKYARTRHLLANNGEDFLEPQPEIPQIIQYLNNHLEDATVIHSNYEDLISSIKASRPQLDSFEGEMRSGRYLFLLPGVLSTRIYLKQTNERTQTYLEKVAEPLATLAWLEGQECPEEILRQAWKYLLQGHPHDSICGSGVDEVHRDVMRRLAWSQHISKAVAESSLKYLAEKIDTANEDTASQPIIVFNTLNWTRTDAVSVKLQQQPTNGTRSPSLELRDSDGRSAQLQVNNNDEQTGAAEKPGETELSFLAEKIPPYGYRVYFLTPSQKANRISTLKVNTDSVENEYFHIQVNRNGTLNVRDKSSNLTFERLLLFEDVEDAGDEYNFSPAKISQKITSEDCDARITVQTKGPVSATLKIEATLNLPEELAKDRNRRSCKNIPCRLESYITLHSGVRRIDIRTVFENNVKDHRLRAVFPSDIKTSRSEAEGQFDIIQRSIDLPAAADWKEPPAPTHPQQSFVTISDEKKSLTLINQGLPEYEALRTENGTALALTLLRCVGWLSREDLQTRKGRAGPLIHTPEAQCLGKHEFRYALLIIPQKEDETNKAVWQDAYNHNTPLLAQTTSKHPGSLPKTHSFL
ncbi:MAG: hypothetical protein M1503_11120, partial [Thaumarchaeota archaeon]|nr:hypothetical protein [Nitrososphaerota archaeon]